MAGVKPFMFKVLVFLLYQRGTNYPKECIKEYDVDKGIYVVSINALSERIGCAKFTLSVTMKTLAKHGYINIIKYPPKHKYLISFLNPPNIIRGEVDGEEGSTTDTGDSTEC